MALLQRSIRLASSCSPFLRTSSLGARSHLTSGHFFFASDSKSVPSLPKEEFDKMVQRSKVVVFMKGVPAEPKCGFSNAVVQILRMHGVDKYDSHDVLSNEAIRQGIKNYTNWPTIPQVFINGDFVGGCDIMVQMHQNGDLVKELEKAGIKSALVEGDAGNTTSKEK